MQKNQAREAERLFKNISKSFGENLKRAMRVSSETDDGTPTKITQHSLAARAEIGRSTLANYIADQERRDVSINPDLETLCKLAYVFNVPPALLLMRPEDWIRLTQAATTMMQAMEDSKVQEISEKLIKGKKRLNRKEALETRDDPVPCAMAAVQVAERFALLSAMRVPAGSLNADIERVNRKMRQGVLATAALLPINDLPQDYVGPLLSLCANLGATLVSNNQGEH